ncbi:SDR family NAD(P)-dependent oxidoreductase, partial [Burkholderia pseudomallei]|uniref:SDR family NAD(P)-dependent oxidoreductase n=2 Tax=Burkholderia pseudomallei TaxID=28450 RepID=UPI0021BB6655
MDLGIRGKRAIVCAGSKGLGRGVAEKLAEAGVELTLNARTESTLRQTAAEIAAAYGVRVRIVSADITTEEGRRALLEAEPHPDILINNAGGPPPGHWADWESKDWDAALNANMLTPISFMKAILPGMIERKWGRVVNITSGSVKSPIGELGLSSAARSGLTGYVAGTARQVARYGVVINNLLPGLHETDRIQSLFEKASAARGISIQRARADAHAANPTGRFGTKEEFGAAAAFLCSQRWPHSFGQFSEIF